MAPYHHPARSTAEAHCNEPQRWRPPAVQASRGWSIVRDHRRPLRDDRELGHSHREDFAVPGPQFARDGALPGAAGRGIAHRQLYFAACRQLYLPTDGIKYYAYETPESHERACEGFVSAVVDHGVQSRRLPSGTTRGRNANVVITGLAHVTARCPLLLAIVGLACEPPLGGG